MHDVSCGHSEHVSELLGKVGDYFSADQISEFISYMDADGDGEVQFEELEYRFASAQETMTVILSSGSQITRR